MTNTEACEEGRNQPDHTLTAGEVAAAQTLKRLPGRGSMWPGGKGEAEYSEGQVTTGSGKAEKRDLQLWAADSVEPRGFELIGST